MPYADRETQLAYMRKYMIHKRRVKRRARLIKEKARLQQIYEAHPEFKYLQPEGSYTSGIDHQIAELDGLLICDKIVPKEGTP